MSFALVLKKTSWYRRRYSRPLRVKVNVFKSQKNLCVTLRNVTTEHLFSAIKHTPLGVIP